MVTTSTTQLVARLLLLPALMLSAAILVKGYASVGDGFAAGAVAAAALLVQYAAFGHEHVERTLPLRHAARVMYVGLGLALAVALLPMLAGDAPLTHAPAAGADVVELGSLKLISALAFDAGIFLLVVGAIVATVHAIIEARDDDSEDA